MNDTGRFHNDEFEPGPLTDRIDCYRTTKPRDLKYLKEHVYDHLSNICKKCKYEIQCKEKEDS